MTMMAMTMLMTIRQNGASCTRNRKKIGIDAVFGQLRGAAVEHRPQHRLIDLEMELDAPGVFAEAEGLHVFINEFLYKWGVDQHVQFQRLSA